MTDADIALADLDRRIAFHDDLQVMEADFSGFHFDTSATVNRFYDRLEERIAQTGEKLWFFLVNLNGARIDPDAWIAYSRRGKALNLAHSMGSVRFDASPETARQILRDANTEAFDPNLCTSRGAALDRIRALPGKRRTQTPQQPNYRPEDFARRIAFNADTSVMEVDFSHFTFHHSRDVDDFYDHIQARLAATGRKWFFLVNLNDCQILPAAWVQYALRGKKVNEAFSLGSARFAADAETETDIRLRAQTQGFRPNIRNTRAEALALIGDMRATLAQG